MEEKGKPFAMLNNCRFPLFSFSASRYGELRVKEALHIHLTPEDQRFNRDVGLAAGFPLSGFVREAMPTTIDLISKGFSPFFMNELHGCFFFFILNQSEPVMHHALLSLYVTSPHVIVSVLIQPEHQVEK